MAATRRNAARKGHRAAGAAYPNDPLLERLAQGLQRRHGELTELVEEQDAVGGQADFARPQRPAPPADEGDDGGLVVRGAEGRALKQLAVGQGAAGGRVDAGHRERLIGRERREQAHQALGQHGLARAGRSDHQEVVAPGRRNLNGPTTEGLAPHVGQVGGAVGAVGGCWRRRRRAGQSRLAPQQMHQLAQRGRTPHVGAATSAASRTSQRGTTSPSGACSVGQGDHARDMAQRAVEPELAAEREAVGAGGAELPGGDEQPHRDRQVEAGAPLADARGSEVDGEPPEGPGQTAGQDGGAHPVAASRTAASGRPTMVKPGRPLETWTSTETGAPDGAGQRRGCDDRG